jgi:hypothetical protein
MAVSADTLFHFTSKESLMGILDSRSFWPTYSKEHFGGVLPQNHPYVISHIPMISFCDLRLTQLSNPSISLHTGDFGKFGIGFKKAWGTKNKISPVVYVHSKSLTSGIINELIEEFRSIDPDSKENLRESFLDLIKFMKPYEGHYQKGNWKKKVRRYYDEREWRFIPASKEFTVFPKKELNDKSRITFNRKMKNAPLRFIVSDIKFIVVEKDIDKVAFASFVEGIDMNKKYRNDLITKIISFEEINNDY